jgi:hypothetical protein
LILLKHLLSFNHPAGTASNENWVKLIPTQQLQIPRIPYSSSSCW